MNGDRPTPPPGSGDRTIIRPTPGGRAAPSPPGGGRPPPLSGGVGEGAPALTAFGLTALNPLVEAAMPLLMLCCGLRGTRDHADVATLHAETVRQVQAFEQTAAERGAAQESILAARYTLCTFIDEVVMNTPWGANSLWPGRALLLTFHRDSAGGEKVFQMIERVLTDRQPRRDLVEFFHVCLALGLQGQYRVTTGGEARLAELRERLYGRIRQWRESPPDELSPAWRGVEDRRHRLVRTLPAWVCVVLVLVLGSAVYFTLNNALNRASAPVIAQLNEVRQATFASPVDLPVSAPAVPVAERPPTLAELLEGVDPERLQFESGEGGRTTVVLYGEVFASASAEVTEEFRPLLRRIGAALQEVPGSVLVEGHSDNLPIRSARFRDNYELSQARAESAARLLREPLTDPDRIDHAGIGADRPRHRPPDDPANRALNRRIEIQHRSPGGGP
ncbi:OmpA family protein [Halomonas campisalis]|uniref:OmpA family protein n=1 Tax=Billgrantia campisalis TaxID=74661 RepID=A0ABS9P6S6_9GAMM|nr:type IVB secretion system protein IcmH/DotU [Halomonas campisalis]MCG6657483.1 OmpA family protein [Halomonas campisalis]MDR5863170.1 type IVB secretion system protein IcmH/DotU [Halomonas campisalis]